jgi:scyllo-inositol 2-dehydrogenase (NADP+)
LKYGIIGTGWIAEAFIKGVRLLTDSEISAVYSRTEEKGNKFALDNNIPAVYTSLDEFAKGDFNCVYIASPNSLHFEQSLKMLENGKNVICEKPITVTPKELEICSEYASKHGLIYMEAIMYMHTPVRDKLLEAVKHIGKITSAHFDFSQLSSKYAAYKAGEKPNIFNPTLATGCLMDLGVYCVYPAIDLFGVPNKILSSADFLSTGADGSGSAIFSYDDKTVTLTYSKTGQDYSGSAIYGDEGTITIESISKLVNIYLYNKQGGKSKIFAELTKDELMGYEAVEFEKFINNPNDEKYSLCVKRTKETSVVMEKIRDLSGIKFDI